MSSDEQAPPRASQLLRRAPIGATRHVTSLVVSLVATPVGLVMVDIWSRRGTHTVRQGAHVVGGHAGLQFVVLGALLLLVAGGCGALSGLGPLVSAIVWGLIPCGWLVNNSDSFFDTSYRLSPSSSPEILSAQGLALLPAAAALLLAAALCGRWHRILPVADGSEGPRGRAADDDR